MLISNFARRQLLRVSSSTAVFRGISPKALGFVCQGATLGRQEVSDGGVRMSFLEQLTRSLFDARADISTSEASRLRLFDASLSWAVVQRFESDTATRAIDELFRSYEGALGSPASRLLELASRGRSSEVDDIHIETCTTPGTGICATVLALAPLLADAPGERTLQSISAGYEAMTQSASALGGPALLTKGIWPSRAVAPIAGVITAATLLELDIDTSIEAVAIAAGWRCEGELPEPSRELSYAEAILLGATAALSAKDGAKGNRASLEAWESLAVERPTEWQPRTRASKPAVVATSIKPFCGARQTLTATSALLELVEKYSLITNDITKIRVAIPPPHLMMVNRMTIETRLHAISSMQYQIALALLRPEDLYDVQRVPRVDDDIVELMGRIEVRGEPKLLARFPREWGAVVEIDTQRDSYELQLDSARDETNLTWENVRAKGNGLFVRAGVSAALLVELEQITRSFTETMSLERLASLVCSRSGE
jgi:2-methylcitrate dehydratase PrpD